MFAIARKTSFFYFTHLVTFCAPAWPALLKGKGGIISMLAFWVPLWLSSSVLWSEKQESYALLRMLPVTDREIVRAKFGLALAAAFVYWLILSLFNWWAWGSTWEYPFYMALANLTCAVSLPLVACWYIFSWRFGQSALTVGVLAFIVLAIIADLCPEYRSLGLGRRPGNRGRPLAGRGAVVSAALSLPHSAGGLLRAHAGGCPREAKE